MASWEIDEGQAGAQPRKIGEHCTLEIAWEGFVSCDSEGSLESFAHVAGPDLRLWCAS